MAKTKRVAYAKAAKELRQALAGNEGAALTVLADLRQRFGWAGALFTRADAESQLEDVIGDEVVERKLTDEEWNRLRCTSMWSSVLDEILTERGWDIIRQALRDAEVIGVEIEA